MANGNDARAAAVFSAGAAIAAALALINSRKAAAGEAVIPDEVIELIIAIAASSEDIKTGLQEAIRLLRDLGISVQGWPANTDSITGLRVAINPPAGMQLPSIVVPSGMALVIKAWALNPAWLFVGPSLGEVSNINQSFPLLPSEVVTYQVENADQIYIAGLTAGGVPTAGCFACLTVEQRRRGGGV
jgi:hypothetical protein